MAKRAISKSDFVRTMGKRPAKEVVALAAKRGMKLTERYVYVIRSMDKTRARRTLPAITQTPGMRLSFRFRKDDPEAGLRRAIADVGLARARAVLAEVERAFAGA